jgi:hypothetical protein
MDNPAGRLLYWFQDVASAYHDTGEALADAWSKIIEADHQSAAGRARLFRHASLLADQCVAVRTEAEALPEYLDSHLLVEHFDEIEAAVGLFTNMTQVTLQSQLNRINATGYHSLKMLDSALHRNRPQTTVSGETLHGLVKSVDSLLETLQVVEMDDDVRDFVRVRFTEVQEALQDCDVKGAKTVEMVTDAILNNYRREPTMWRRTMESSVGTVVGGILLQLVLNFTGMAPTADALPPGTPEPVVQQTVQVYVEQTEPPETHELESGDDVVDAELVDDEGDGPQSR